MTALGIPQPARLLPDRRFAAGAFALAALIPPTLAAMALDPRLFQGDSVWLKPLKFEIALAVYLATLALMARWLPAGWLARPGVQRFQIVVLACIAAEMVWIGGAAAFGVASHYSTQPLLAAVYPVMGLVAIVLTAAAPIYGLAIWRASTLPPGARAAVALGLILTFALTLPTAGALAGFPGHTIGTPASGATVPLIGWSREVGDLRSAHFLATHAMHLVPLAGLAALWLPARGAIAVAWAAAAGWTALTGYALALGLAGRPLIGI